jgi:hypothetical protein
MEKAIGILFSRTTIHGPYGFYTEGPFIQVAIITVIFAAAWAYSLVWLYRDAKNRDKNPWIALLLILVTGYPISFFWWFWLRPPLRERELAYQSGAALPPVPSTSNISISNQHTTH